MTVYFVDTSALPKRYLQEAGSVWVNSWIQPSAGNIVIISRLAIVEMYSLLARMRRGRLLRPNAVKRLQAAFDAHVDREYLPVSVDDSLLLQARGLADKHTLRTLDSIQLACAVQAYSLLNHPMTFVSADNQLLLAAGAEGFAVDNPLNYP